MPFPWGYEPPGGRSLPRPAAAQRGSARGRARTRPGSAPQARGHVQKGMTGRMFRRIAIVNRGEAAMRLIHAARELAEETGAAIETIALHTDVDRGAAFVHEADVAYDLGPASTRPYLDLKVLKKALVETGADAAWPGWGFVAEDPAFASLCDEIGVAFVGPSAEAMRRLGDKIGAKLLAEEVGVPVAPWSRGPVESLDAA